MVQTRSTAPKYGRYRRDKVRELRVAKGIPPTVPVEKTSTHVQWLSSIGFNDYAIAAAAGIAQTTVWEIRNRIYETTQMDIAARIMSVGHTPVPAQARSRVPAFGVHRRIRALCAIGWGYTEVGRRLSVSHQRVAQIGASGQIDYETWRAIADIYDELSGEPGPSAIVRSRAVKKGWAPPLAWEGVDIDHPDARPNLGDDTTASDIDEVLLLRILRGDYDGDIPTPERKAVIDHAIEHGWTKYRVAQVLNLKPATADQALIRRRRELRKTREVAA
jgi:hypothetical protein